MRNEPAELMALALPRLLSAIEVDSTIEMNDRNTIVPMASPSLTSRESLIEMLGMSEKIMGKARGGLPYLSRGY